MSTRITGHAGALVTAIVVLIGGAILRGGAAEADPGQDEQFLALLDQEQIPALRNVPNLIASAHKVCRKLDGGMTMDDLVDQMVNNAYRIDPPERLYDPGRLARTEARFITAAVGAYCPYDQSKLASSMANPTPRSNESTRRVALYTDDAVNSGAPLIEAVPSGEIPDPPEIPAPPPPTAQTQTPPRPIAAPPTPKQSPPPPRQAEPPAIAPQPGGAGGSGGASGAGGTDGGGAGGGRPAGPSPTRPAPPGLVRLAP